ncbi:metalloreductase STEAP3-like [Erpetoichthys calabaricus]|uniref:STEAP3 metalloreductase n=1 Tax=Erpetoichthys calabaricus TaxID=27687 RepID=A0A8C4S6Z7_ERPCA|nr:metalloreductase STEAP3-like [Erpetoichthys calabaricus]
MTQGDMAKPLLRTSSEGVPSFTSTSKMAIGILGSGDFARSLATRLICSGFKVVVGSRNPKRNAGLFPQAAEVTTQLNAVNQTELIFIAVFKEHYFTLLELKSILAGKVLVDVSNSTDLKHQTESNAEYLASLFPDSIVVKGFNVISAWALQSGPRDGNKQVFICSDNRDASAKVCQIARTMGFIPVDMGSLSCARDIESFPLRLFPSWKKPFLVSFGLFIFFYFYNFIISVLHPYLTKNQNAFYKMPIELMNVTLPCVAYVLLSLVYLPGILAAFLQLKNNTKYKRFPDWLDQWLKHRKQLGLLSFYAAVLHAVYSLCLPMRRSARYELLNDAYKQVQAGKENAWVEEEVWRMELYVSCGIMALGMLSLLAISSLPSVGSALSWREFSFIQSRLGYVALMTATLHTLLYGWKRAFDKNRYKFYLPPTFTLTLVIPCIVLLSKLCLLLPCVNRRLMQIQRGWEKKAGSQVLEGLGCFTDSLPCESISNV